MRIRTARTVGNPRQAFSLVEVTFGAAILGVVFVSVSVGIAASFGVIRTARENLRATQVLQQQAEVVRLLTWDQIIGNVNPAPPWTFTARFDPAGGTRQGVTYYGTIGVSDAPVSGAYTNTLRLVTISLTWTNSNVPHNRELRTLYSQYGLQNYLIQP